MRAVLALCLMGCLMGCASAQPAPSATSATDAPASPLPAPAANSASKEVPAAPVETVTLLSWKRELETPVVSLALGKRRTAALAQNGVWMHEGDRWTLLPFPEALRAQRGEREELRVFFGRDDRPRVMGTRWAGAEARGVYLRHRGSWANERGELGKLSSGPAAALFGVLGHDDPEVVCKLGDICVIKRLTGWTFVPVSARPLLVELAGSTAWGLGERELHRLGAQGWERVGGEAPFARAGGVWGDDAVVWVSEPEADALHRFETGKWSRHASPLKAPLGLWGSGRGDVWLAGGGGAAHYDGRTWRRVAGVAGPLREVRARGGEVWLAGESGVWLGEKR